MSKTFEIEIDDLLGTERVGQVPKEEVRNVKGFYIVLAATIVFIVSNLILAIDNIADSPIVWARFYTLTVVALFVLSFIAEKNLGKGVTIAFFNRIFGKGFIKSTTLSGSMRTYPIVLIAITIVLMPMIIYVLFSGI